MLNQFIGPRQGEGYVNILDDGMHLKLVASSQKLTPKDAQKEHAQGSGTVRIVDSFLAKNPGAIVAEARHSLSDPNEWQRATRRQAKEAVRAAAMRAHAMIYNLHWLAGVAGALSWALFLSNSIIGIVYAVIAFGISTILDVQGNKHAELRGLWLMRVVLGSLLACMLMSIWSNGMGG